MPLEVPEVLGDGLRVHPAHAVLELREPDDTAPQVPDDQEVPLTPDDIDDALDVASGLLFAFHSVSLNTFFGEILLQITLWCF
jgi:hypothetical protein